MAKRVLIIKTGSSVPAAGQRFGDFDQWFINGLGPERFDYCTIGVHDGEQLPGNVGQFDGIVITGSPAMVSHRHEWSERAAEWIAATHASGTPMLGVCYGHQLIAHALGGKVGPNPFGRRMGSLAVEIIEESDPLIGAFAPGQHFQATHVEAVLEPPVGSRVIARGEGDPHHGLYFGNASWGLQFHPEFNIEIMDCYIRSRQSVLTGEGIYTDRLLASLTATPCGAAVLERFAELVDDPAELPPAPHRAT